MIRTASSQRWLVLAALGLAYFFVNFATFASLGVVLFTMARELDWSMTAAGFTFSLLGLACGLSSTLPTIAMKYVGARGSMAVGAGLFLVGCLLAAVSHSLATFDVAIAMMGAGYTFAGNIPAVILIAQWFENGSARIVGIYLMVGALGTAAAPPTVEFVVRELGWRAHWEIMSVVALLVGLVCFAFVRDRAISTIPADQTETSVIAAGPTWTPRRAVFTIQFAVLTAALVVTMTAVTTINGIVVTHLAKLGLSTATAAWALGALSFTGTLMKGLTGHLCESKSPKAFVVLGLLCQAAGCALLTVSTTTALAFAAAILFGAGWAFALVAGWVVLMRYFGGPTGARVLAIVQLITTVGAAGPIGGGLIADRWGTFTPIFLIYAVVLSALIIPVMLLRPPAATCTKAVPDEYEQAAIAEPA